MQRAVPLGTDARLFTALHRRFLDGPRTPPEWDRLDASSLSDPLREELRRAWSARTVAEYRSMVVFSEMIARIPEAGLPLEVSCACSRLLQDEARHTELCARVAEALGGRDDATVETDDLHLADERMSPMLFVARWTLSMFCVGETASVGLLRALQRDATDPCIAAVLDTLQRDESLHDRFGWSLAGLVLPQLTDDEREWLAADMAFTFAHYDRLNGAKLREDGKEAPDDRVRGDGAERFGLVSRERFARAWYERLDKVILPKLDALGMPAYESWTLRHEAK